MTFIDKIRRAGASQPQADLLERLVDGIADLYQAFGAPWTNSLPNAQNEALHNLYRLLPEAAAARSRMPAGERREPLEARLAECLAEAIDTPLFTFFELGGEIRQAAYLGSFRPEIAERACVLLEEAGR